MGTRGTGWLKETSTRAWGQGADVSPVLRNWALWSAGHLVLARKGTTYCELSLQGFLGGCSEQHQDPRLAMLAVTGGHLGVHPHGFGGPAQGESQTVGVLKAAQVVLMCGQCGDPGL